MVLEAVVAPVRDGFLWGHETLVYAVFVVGVLDERF